jgi:hypothetical protein
MRCHNHQIRSQPLLYRNNHVAGFADFDDELPFDARWYVLRMLPESSDCRTDLLVIEVLAGESLRRSLGGLRNNVQDVRQVKGCIRIRCQRYGVSRA